MIEYSRLASVSKAKIPSFVWGHHETKASSHDMTVARVNMKSDVMEIEAVAGYISDNIVAKIPMIQECPVMGLEVLGQTVWVVHWYQSSLYAYPMTSPHQAQTLSIQEMSPIAMVRFPPGQSQLVISDGNNQLLWVKVEQHDDVWRVTSQRSIQVRYRPRGIGVCDNQLLVCDSKVIHVLSTSGKEIHKVSMPQGVRPCKAVVQLTSPGFVVMDYDNKQVVLVSEKGEIQHTYQGQKGFNPRDIVCHDHSIYVTDHNNDHVDELSVDGRHIKQLIRGQGVWCPCRMCVDDTGRLYVAQGGRGKYEVWVIETTVTPTDTQAAPGDRILTQQTNMNLSVTWCD